MVRERLQKILAGAGVASRRAAEELIANGRITVNGRIASLGESADPATDTIALDGRPLPRPDRTYIALNKPTGYVTSLRSTHGEPTVPGLINLPERVFPVGRLDKDTSGLLLLTNDGDWANVVTHPRYGIEKEYRALVRGVPTADTIARMERGVTLPDGTVTGPARVRILSRDRGRALLQLILTEGKKRQIRLMAQAVGHPVELLERIRVGPVRLGTLAPGQWRRLSAEEISAVRRVEAEHAGSSSSPTFAIAIDGPAGAGKSTLAASIASALGCAYVDTGLMYRAVALAALQSGVVPSNGSALSGIAVALGFELSRDGKTLLIDGHAPPAGLRSAAVDRTVSEVSAHPEVRAVLTDKQRRLVRGRCVVMVGRDIGTVVLPEAPVKLWVTASPETRARRRTRQDLDERVAVSEGDVARDLTRRDLIDSERPVAPARRPPGAVTIDTDRLTPQQALERALGVIRAAGGSEARGSHLAQHLEREWREPEDE